jgi:hypothetical protein
MRAFPAVLLAVAGAALCTDALAQDRDGMHTPHTLAPSATTGAASSAPAMRAPVGHRQPRAADAPSSETNGPAVSPYDQQIDRDLNICRGC